MTTSRNSFTWQCRDRQLLLVEGRPYLLALPDCVDGPALEIELLDVL